MERVFFKAIFCYSKSKLMAANITALLAKKEKFLLLKRVQSSFHNLKILI